MPSSRLIIKGNHRVAINASFDEVDSEKGCLVLSVTANNKRTMFFKITTKTPQGIIRIRFVRVKRRGLLRIAVCFGIRNASANPSTAYLNVLSNSNTKY